MSAIVFPLLYVVVTFSGNYYIYAGRVVEGNKNLADFINNWSDTGWELNQDPAAYGKTNDASTNLPNVIAQYYTQYQPNSSTYMSSVNVDSKVYAGYIANNQLTICDSVTYLTATDPSKSNALGTGVLPTTAPVLDTMTLSAPGPVWIVVSAYTVKGISRTVTAIRRPPLGSLLISRNNVSRYCKLGFTSF